jgi:hypothetical protein
MLLHRKAFNPEREKRDFPQNLKQNHYKSVTRVIASEAWSYKYTKINTATKTKIKIIKVLKLIVLSLKDPVGKPFPIYSLIALILDAAKSNTCFLKFLCN